MGDVPDGGGSFVRTSQRDVEYVRNRNYRRRMVVTIDRAGRLVVPKALRERYNLTPGCKLEIEAAPDGITLRRADTVPALIRKQCSSITAPRGWPWTSASSFALNETVGTRSPVTQTERVDQVPIHNPGGLPAVRLEGISLTAP